MIGKAEFSVVHLEKVDENTMIVGGRCNVTSVKLGHVFTCLYFPVMYRDEMRIRTIEKKIIEELEVKVESICYYGKELDKVDVGMSASLKVIGDVNHLQLGHVLM